LRIVEVPVLAGAFIQRARGLHHPGLEEPVIYLGGTALAPLVLDVTGPSTPDEIMRRWSTLMPAQAAWDIMNWMVEVGILVSDTGRREAAPTFAARGAQLRP
jgi:hypothetical protein